jgi:ATP-dependent DNA helicase RecQ
VIAEVIAGRDAIVVMPTGSGKSICYQIPSLVREYGVRAAMLNSSLTGSQQADVIRQLRAGYLDILYVAPERLLTDSVLDLLSALPLALFAIDEAHCVARWGHDFRPEYLGLSILAERFPDTPRLALTATADERTRREIAEQLRLVGAAEFVAGFDRPNIRYQITSKDNVKRQLLSFLEQEHPTDSGIVYCLTRGKTEEMATWLTGMGRTALPYHAGMSQDRRRSNQARFLREEGLIIVATIAFGMGIDKPDVRFVAHVDLPRSIEAYYQETGRAGRDGLPANAWMAYGLSDAVMHRRFIEQSEADESFKRVERGKLNALIGLCETTACRRQILLEYFGDSLPAPCGNCDTCLTPVETWDATLAARKALYLVRATGERFGAQYLIDVLLGKESPRIRQFGHANLSAYGGGAELTAKQWNSTFRQLVTLGYLSVDLEGFGALKLTPESADVLVRKAQVRMRKDAEQIKRTRAERRREAKIADLPQSDAALYEALRRLRSELAAKEGLPPYVFFHDATLKAIASVKPTTLAALREIPGIGDAKLKAHGDALLEIVKEYVISTVGR